MPTGETAVEDTLALGPHVIQNEESKAEVLFVVEMHPVERRAIEIQDHGPTLQPCVEFLIEIDDDGEIWLAITCKVGDHRLYGGVGNDTVAQRGFDERGNIGRFGLSEQRSDKSDRNQRDNSKQIASGGLSP